MTDFEIDTRRVQFGFSFQGLIDYWDKDMNIRHECSVVSGRINQTYGWSDPELLVEFPGGWSQWYCHLDTRIGVVQEDY